MNIYTNLKSDCYKILHTPIWLIHVMIPIVGIAVFIGYYSISPWDETDKLSAYIQALAIVFPVLIGMITALFTELEQGAGGFQAILSCTTAKSLPHTSKLLLLMLLGLLAALLALVGFGTAFIKMGYARQSLLFYGETAFLLWLSVVPLYLIHYLVSFRFGKGVSIGLGIVGTLLGALLLTGLGDGIWPYLPWGISARFAEMWLTASLSNMAFLEYNDVIKGSSFIFMYTLLFTTIFVLSFNKWEGRKSDD